jgi:c-di-GMP phosphodiesterase
MDYALVLPADRVILEVVTLPLPDTALVEAARALADQGYNLTLSTQRDMVTLHPLLEAAHLIKIDLQQWSMLELRDHVAQCRQYNARLLADHVDSPTDAAYCIDLGFDYLQGAISGPLETLACYRSPTHRSSWRHLMTHLINPVANTDMIESIFRHDLSLTYKLLRLVHTRCGHTLYPIISIRQALEAIGIRALITWASFVLLSDFDDMPHEMTNTAVLRAHMCEFLAQVEGLAATDTFYLTGLISGLDTILDRPLSELLDTLPLHEDIRQSLLGNKGDVSRMIKAVCAYEQGRWDDLQALSIDSSAITDSYLQAIVQMESHKDVT